LRGRNLNCGETRTPAYWICIPGMYVCKCMHIQCIYEYVCVCVLCTCLCVSLSVCARVCIYERMYVSVYVCMYACMYAYMHACMHVCMYVCMYACMHVCICLCINVHLHAYVCVCVCLCAHVCIEQHAGHFKCVWTRFLVTYHTSSAHGRRRCDKEIEAYLTIYRSLPRATMLP
jgi:hypothetical protein